MGRPLLLEVADKPATSAAIAVCVGAWLLITQRRLGYEDVGMSYDKVVRGRQAWRMIVCQFSHVEALHLIFNVSALWSLGGIETSPKMGTGYYLRASAALIALSQPLCLAFYHLLITVGGRERYARVTAVGYSCVTFGLMSALSVNELGMGQLSLFGLASIPAPLAPFGYLVLTSVLIPRASFIGHLSGVLVGYVVGFGVFEQLTPFWAVSLALWGALGALVGLVRSGAVSLPFVRFEEEGDVEAGLAVGFSSGAAV
ncbi:unnamed protein product [Ostreobium quekettii]|uniref:Peptidase S54 rhomboid domain-containing protein n=1 Tax=Ostreobium quekettii TaxID=121088 RepID=A0A8S1JBU2_9CHLO|nr:unnamed protein product [Ostreobium quekettii]|eukprot:evm.model.scf_317.8 EVM.evm.TU.scf_317.8   scf_317:83265-84035(-)